MKHISYTVTTDNTKPLYGLLEMEALEIAMAGNAVVEGGKTTYYFEREERRGKFITAITDLGVMILGVDTIELKD